MSITLKDVSYTYAPGTAFAAGALRNVSLSVEDGEFVGIMGRTGCGKSTLIQLIAGLLTPEQGQVLVDGEDINSRDYDRLRLRRRVGVVFQHPEHQLFETTVEKDVAFGLRRHDLSKEEKDVLLETIRRNTGTKDVSDVKYKNYSTALEAARALMDGEVDAAVYREAYGTVLEEVMESFSADTRVVDTYEIRTEMEYESVEPGEPFNLLISGIDVKGDISQASRSDVNIIVTINPKTKKILMTTTPRDYYVEIPEVSYGKRDKLTHAGISVAG